jgi:hypothetical protein
MSNTELVNAILRLGDINEAMAEQMIDAIHKLSYSNKRISEILENIECDLSRFYDKYSGDSEDSEYESKCPACGN